MKETEETRDRGDRKRAKRIRDERVKEGTGIVIIQKGEMETREGGNGVGTEGVLGWDLGLATSRWTLG